MLEMMENGHASCCDYTAENGKRLRASSPNTDTEKQSVGNRFPFSTQRKRIGDVAVRPIFRRMVQEISPNQGRVYFANAMLSKSTAAAFCS
jgi:hypothetical protein